MKDLGIDKNKDALAAYQFFLAIEFKQSEPQKNNRYAAIYYAFNTQTPDNQRYSDKEFTAFLKKLDMKYLSIEPKSFLARAAQDTDHWAKRPLRNVVNRITTLENDRADVYPDYKPTATAVSVAAWGGSTFLKERNGWDIFPLNVPQDKGKESLRTALRFLPTEIAADTTNGGLSLAYEAYLYHEMGFVSGLDLKASYNFQSEQSDFVRVDVDAFKEFDDFIKFGAGISGFGNMEDDFYNKESAYGANVYVDFLDIFRLTYVRRAGDEDFNNNGYLYFGIENIPSLIYWLNR